MERKSFTVLDGAMGTLLQAQGLPVGYPSELWCLEKPEVITEIHRRYVEAGSRVIYANTFCANRLKLKGAEVSEVITAAVSCARKAIGDRDVKVALDIGPIGQLLKPLGTLSFDEAYDIFREMLIAGEQAGADLVVFETMSDLFEVKAAVLAAKENTALPVWVTMTFEKNGRTFVGTTVASMALTLEGLGVEAMGFNCSLGTRELLPMVRELSLWTDKPIILKPNAGLPDPYTGEYQTTPKQFAKELSEAVDLGVTILGGCCGTTPEFIGAVCNMLNSPAQRTAAKRTGICSSGEVCELSGVRVIGERINPTGKKRFQQALKENDMGYILQKAIEQQDAGADILDVNVGLPGLDEPELMKKVVTDLQSIITTPLQIDSSDVKAIEAGLRYYNGKPIVNSVNGDREVLSSVLPLCKKYGAAVIGLTLDSRGVPSTAEERVAIAKTILEAALSYGIKKEDVYIDCLTLTVSAQQEQAAETLKAVRYVKEVMGLHTVLGVSNISFGLPQRENITVSFLTQALSMGLDLPIVNPNQAAVMDAISSFRVLSGEDRNCEGYIERFSSVPTQSTPAAPSELTLEEAVFKGLKEETGQLTRAALEHMGEMEVINGLLIPALDRVGESYERQELFLPQLINAANAACEGFEVIKTRIAASGERSVSKGKIIIATVKGDIHDIGKNIVRVVLENYGFTVIDLGRDVPPEVIVDTAVKENVRLVGLSALMTTTVSGMRETIEALRKSSHCCKIMVGGAVLTEDYAREIGADYYAKDAKQSADIAKAVFRV